MNVLGSFLELARYAFAQTLRGRRLVLLLLLVALPISVALSITGAARTAHLPDFQMWALLVLLRGVVPLGALYLGVAVVGDEIEGRTITYLFTRPVPRGALYLARFLGTALAFLLLLVAAIWVSGNIFARRFDVAPRRLLLTAGIGALGFLVYGALFAALRLFLQRALLVGFLLGFIVEGFLMSLPPGGFPRISLWHHLAVCQVAVFEGVLGAHDDLLVGIAPEETAGGSLRVLAVVLAVCLLVGAVRIARAEIRIPSSVA